MSDIDKKRAYVADLYHGRGWRKRVSKMSDAQVVAIYLREHAKAQNSTSEEKPDDDPDTLPF